jgi:DnaJ-class molecular chaperone
MDYGIGYSVSTLNYWIATMQTVALNQSFAVVAGEFMAVFSTRERDGEVEIVLLATMDGVPPGKEGTLRFNVGETFEFAGDTYTVIDTEDDDCGVGFDKNAGRRMPLEICECCQGEGTQCRLGALSEETMADMDEDDWAAYKGGRYDDPCGACAGRGMVRQGNQGTMYIEDGVAVVRAHGKSSWMDDPESRMERRMGA